MSTLEKSGKLNISPIGQETIGMFSGTYINVMQDNDIESSNDMYFATKKRNNLLSGTLLTIIYSVLALASYILCYIRMKKKDIT